MAYECISTCLVQWRDRVTTVAVGSPCDIHFRTVPNLEFHEIPHERCSHVNLTPRGFVARAKARLGMLAEDHLVVSAFLDGDRTDREHEEHLRPTAAVSWFGAASTALRHQRPRRCYYGHIILTSDAILAGPESLLFFAVPHRTYFLFRSMHPFHWCAIIPILRRQP